MPQIHAQFNGNYFMLLESIQAYLVPEPILPPALLLFGEEDFLLQEAYQALLQHVAGNEAGFDLDITDAEQISQEQLASMASAYPLLSQTRVVVIRNAEKLFTGKSRQDEQKSALLRYLRSPQPTTFIILCANLPELNGITAAHKNPRQKDKYEKILKNLKAPWLKLLDTIPYMEFPKVREQDLASWIARRLRSNGKDITPEAAEFMIAHAGTALRDLHNEIEKLILYAQGKKKYTEQDVLGVVGSSRTYNVFELQKAIGDYNLPTALEILHHMMDEDKQEMLIITMLTRYFTSLWKLSAALQLTKNQFELSKSTGISSFFIPEYQAALQRMSPENLQKSFFLLRNADMHLKSSNESALTVLQNMLIQMIPPMKG